MAGDDDGESVNSATIEQLVNDDLDEQEVVLRVEHHEKSLDVTRRAKKSMEMAMVASSNQPTYFFKARFVVQAVCDILETDIVEYSFPKDHTSGVAFDWKKAFPGRENTYPPAHEPSKDEFNQVKTVYEAVKEEKDAEAKQRGMPSSGIQAYPTFQQKWCSWRRWCAIYKAMNPGMPDKTVLDLITGSLKLLPSHKTIMEAISLDVKKHRAKILQKERLAARKSETATALTALKTQATKSKEDLEKIKEQEANLKQARTNAENRKTRSGAGRSNAVLKVVQDEKKLRKEKVKVKRTIKKLAKQVQAASKRKKSIESAVGSAPKKKKTLRNDLDLVNASVTPRQLVELDGEEFKPPREVVTDGVSSFEKPGAKWVKASLEKEELLLTLHKHLFDAGEVEATPTFNAVMEALGLDDMEEVKFEFFDRAFIQLVALTLFEYL